MATSSVLLHPDKVFKEPHMQPEHFEQQLAERHWCCCSIPYLFFNLFLCDKLLFSSNHLFLGMHPVFLDFSFSAPIFVTPSPLAPAHKTRLANHLPKKNVLPARHANAFKNPSNWSIFQNLTVLYPISLCLQFKIHI